MKSTTAFPAAAYYFSGLFLLIIAGFWPSYFVKFFDRTASFSLYFHFHAAMLMFWLLLLIIQPILIRKRKLQWHRLLGKFSYVFFPLMCVSIVLMIHLSHGHNVNEDNLGNTLLGQSKNFFIFVTGYVIAIKYRRSAAVHARGMIVTGIALIEPALTRLFLNIFTELKWFVTSPDFFWYASVPTILLIFSLMIVLIIKERRQQKGRWVFPFTLGLYLILYTLMITQI
ncbi:MAG: hypothetical protein ABIU30_22790, partial [Ferruginibacter sp.]